MISDAWRERLRRFALPISLASFVGLVVAFTAFAQWQRLPMTIDYEYTVVDRYGNESDGTLTSYGWWSFVLAVMLSVRLHNSLRGDSWDARTHLQWKTWAIGITVVMGISLVLDHLPRPVPARFFVEGALIVAVALVCRRVYYALVSALPQ